ncbi:DUF2474 family protein [Rhodophyticola sp. CCM32]|nr:DUF2474 family protein [Rhodophyticola sp. CCM32]QBX99481.1 DUF2474 family protein [Rhodophyticola sp. CCM32]
MQPRATLRKLGWFVAIWIMSVTALGLVAYIIRLALKV